MVNDTESPPTHSKSQANLPASALTQKKSPHSSFIIIVGTLSLSFVALVLGNVLITYHNISPTFVDNSPIPDAPTLIPTKLLKKTNTPTPSLTPTHPPLNHNQSFQIGNFTYTPKNNTIHTGENLSNTISLVDPKFESENHGSVCTKVSGVSMFRSILHFQDQLTGIEPNINMITWNSSNLEFIDPESQEMFNLWIQNLSQLDQYLTTDTENPILQDTLRREQAHKQWVDNPQEGTLEQDLLEFPRLLACGGGYNWPIFLKKIESDKFEKVYFAESFIGNGVPYAPNKMLIINHQDRWLLLTQHDEFSNELDRTSYNYSECGEEDMSITCLEQVWSSKYRSEEEIDNWINNTISSLEFTTL